MPKFKVIKELNMNGIIHSVGSVIELDKVMSSLKSIQANLERLPDNAPAASADKSVLGSIKPGEQLTPEQKEKLAKENVTVTAEAQRLAAEHRARDFAEGKGEPAVKAVAEILKEKLAKEDFQSKGVPAQGVGELPPEVPPAN